MNKILDYLKLILYMIEKIKSPAGVTLRFLFGGDLSAVGSDAGGFQESEDI